MKKRFLAIVLLVVMVFSFVGCSPTELGFVEMIKSVLMLQDFTFDGSIALNIKTLEENQLPDIFEKKNAKSVQDNIQEVLPLSFEAIKELANTTTLVYSGAISKTDDKMAISIGTKVGNEPTNTIIKLILSGKSLYVSRDFIETYELDATTYETFGGTEYAEFDVDALITQYIDDTKANLTNEPWGYPWIENEEEKSEDYILGFYEGYTNGLHDGYFEETTPAVDGSEEFELGYADGYSLGSTDGADQKVSYDNNLASLDALGQQLKDTISSTKILNNMGTIKSVLTKGLDGLTNMLFENFSLDLIKIDDTNSYVATTKTGDMLDAIKNTVLYLMDNLDLAKATFKTILDSLTDEELTALGVDPATREDIIADIDNLKVPEDSDLESEKEMFSQGLDEFKTGLLSFVQLNTRSSFEKIGLNSFDNETVVSVKTLTNDLPFSIDAALISKLSINKNLDPEISATDSFSILNKNSAQIKITMPNSSAYTVGILLSEDEFFTDCKVIKATTLDENGDYIINLTDLDPQNNYYYKTFTTDESGNVIYSADYKEISLIEDSTLPSNPPTGDSNPTMPIVITLGLIGIVSLSRKRNKAKA